MIEHFFQCPHCWETISMLLDTSIAQQTYIEDCEVCCNPIEISVSTAHHTLTDFSVTSIA